MDASRRDQADIRNSQQCSKSSLVQNSTTYSQYIAQTYQIQKQIDAALRSISGYDNIFDHFSKQGFKECQEVKTLLLG